MKNTIAIVGEYREGYQNHVKLNDSLEHVKEKFGYDFDYEWVNTLMVEHNICSGLLKLLLYNKWSIY